MSLSSLHSIPKSPVVPNLDLTTLSPNPPVVVKRDPATPTESLFSAAYAELALDFRRTIVAYLTRMVKQQLDLRWEQVKVEVYFHHTSYDILAWKKAIFFKKDQNIQDMEDHGVHTSPVLEGIIHPMKSHEHSLRICSTVDDCGGLKCFCSVQACASAASIPGSVKFSCSDSCFSYI